MERQKPVPGKWQLFRIWAVIGLQSFGGGASTTFLIQRLFIERYQLLTNEEFTHFWGLCVLTPGINLIALTILIGKKLGGWLGISVSLAGLLLPSAAITCALTALFIQVEHLSAVQAIMRGVVPATGGVMLLVGLNFAVPLIRKSSKEGILSLLAYCAVILGCALAVIFWKLSAIVVMLGAILLGTLFFTPKSGPSSPQKEGASSD